MQNLSYKIIFSGRRTVSLIINKEGELVVRAPKRVPEYEIQRMVESRRGWILKHLEKAALKKPTTKQYINGQKFWYLGKEYELKILEGYRSRIEFINNTFYISKSNLHKGKSFFEKWYRNQAKDVISSRAVFYSGLMKTEYKSLKITGANTRWGSCSALGNINFSYRLVMAPISVVDYVVVHELAHLQHRNHSKSFWELVGKFYPNFKEARKWLNQNSHKFIL
jgi:predicted metal-dependent hydrolase